MSFISLGLMIGLIAFDVSTAIDRIALYFLPIQLIIFSNLPEAIKEVKNSPSIIIILITLFYAAVMYIWMNYAYHSLYWLPYNNVLFELLEWRLSLVQILPGIYLILEEALY